MMQGGANAGHTIYDEKGTKYALHLVPSGILSKGSKCVVGNGVVVHLPTLFDEIETLERQGIQIGDRLLISDRAHLLFDLHKEIDGLREAELAGTICPLSHATHCMPFGAAVSSLFGSGCVHGQPGQAATPSSQLLHPLSGSDCRPCSPTRGIPPVLMCCSLKAMFLLLVHVQQSSKAGCTTLCHATVS